MTIHLLGQIETSGIKNNDVTNRNCQGAELQSNTISTKKHYETNPYERRFIWRNIIILTYVHVSAIYSVINIMHCKWQVTLFGK